ncbi:(Fe-S)-binding protein [Anaeroselena agilis]|uniref:Glycolate oxidase iron-sulfur subunit n=1 Tax=Anaeroselena agilis TaxID=3063788 RepID=A0ABU3P0A0_9FIRM|nr:(Fe-S)-binding protein [Selenomonadales bacterium 4137-cl]
MKTLKQMREESEKCLRCGLCQIVCPIYNVLGSEPAVARAKVRLARELAGDVLKVTPRMRKIMSLCLNCKACVANCPSQVHTDKLVLAARAQIKDEDGLPFLLGAALKQFLPNNSLQGVAAKSAYLYQHLGLQQAVRGSGLLKAVSPDLAQKEGVMPEFAPRTFRAELANMTLKKGGKVKVAYYLSCMTNMVNPALGKAVIEVLERHGCEVVIPTDVQCCGTPQLAYGDVETAEALARNNARLLAATGADYILTDCGTCGDTLRHYEELTADAAGFEQKVLDVSEFLVDKLGVKPGDKPVEAVVTYHDSCHLNRGQGVNRQPREILKAIPGLTFREMAEADRCCGGAGTFAITNYDLSMAILDRKVGNIKAVNPTIVAAGCPACKMQLEHGLARNNVGATVAHPVELLAKTY